MNNGQIATDVVSHLRKLPLLVLAAAGLIAAAPLPAKAESSSLPVSKSAQLTSASAASSSPKTAWPADVTTHHSTMIGGTKTAFSATAGYITLRNSQTRKPLADIAIIAFARDTQDKTKRPVTFVFNGGPGYASGWLNLGALGPWRLKMQGSGVFPSARPNLYDNTESWLEFTDLVFIDPAGTGYGRIHDKDATNMLWSVEGDIDSLSTVIRRWTEANGRTASPKYLAGESYGGFRVPKITHELQTNQGFGINGMILISPVLDFARRQHGGALSHVGLLPSYAATAMIARAAEKAGKTVTRSDLAPVEAYARGAFLTDLVKGRSDPHAVKRLSERVAELTGLDKDFVARRAGRISMIDFTRQFYRSSGKVASMYDGLVAGLDPDRFAARNSAEDQMRLGLHAPITQAMAGLYRDRLKWVYPEGRYMFQNQRAGKSWKWGRHPPESASELASALALDPGMRVLVTHGLTDLVTPYFETQLVLDDLPPIGTASRITFKVYPGGHMFYSQEASRTAFRDDAKALIGATKKPAD
jgi:carboxypeptidase C (cathepsin A)